MRRIVALWICVAVTAAVGGPAAVQAHRVRQESAPPTHGVTATLERPADPADQSADPSR